MPGQIVAPLAAQRLGLMTMGTFHQRRGDQSFLSGLGGLVYTDSANHTQPGVWGRVFGAHSELGAEGKLGNAGYKIGPEFDGNYWGLQLGTDLLGVEHDNGVVDRFGLFYTHAEASGDISGNILGGISLAAGKLNLNEDSIGAYWTRIAPSGWYLDVVAKYGWLNGSSESRRGIGSDVDGSSFAASVETGRPFELSEGWALEPQAQLIWQHINIDDANDQFSDVTHDSFDAVTGRIGARFEYTEGFGKAHVGLNLWHGFSADSVVKFNDTPFVSEIGGTWLDINVGGSYAFNENVSAFGDVSYSFDVDGNKAETFAGEVGLRIKW